MTLEEGRAILLRPDCSKEYVKCLGLKVRAQTAKSSLSDLRTIPDVKLRYPANTDQWVNTPSGLGIPTIRN